MNPEDILKQYWGFDSFRPKQREIIDAALEGNDVLAILPTGGGKSVCFQVPALMKEGLAIVVTPLVALMKDQVQNLTFRGIKAIAVHAGMSMREVDLALNNAAYGDFKFLYVSPERLSSNLFQSYLPVMDVSFIVVDEAHCISAWGYDFRPDYLQIGKIRETVDAPLIALTATATHDVADDICRSLSVPGREFRRITGGFRRPNLSYQVRECEDKTGKLLEICNAVPGSGIVYLRHRSRCEELAAMLRAGGVGASFYHAGLDSVTRARRQEDWKDGKDRVMVCTNAFGMGIDKADVRFVVHFDLPESPEAYFQEAGRAGRDGKKAYAVLLWNRSDLSRQKKLIQTSFPPLSVIEDVYQKLHVFFSIPYEAGEGRQLKFDLNEFCSHFSMNRSTVYYSIHYLEQSGHLNYVEDMDISTHIRILVDRNSLYDIDLPDPVMVSLLEVLMRKYTGIFSFNVPVREDELASELGIGVPQLRQFLYKTSLEHVIRYIPSDHSNVIILRHPRLRPGNVNLHPDKYRFLRESYEKRSNAISEYATQSDVSCSDFLVSYFGE